MKFYHKYITTIIIGAINLLYLFIFSTYSNILTINTPLSFIVCAIVDGVTTVNTLYKSEIFKNSNFLTLSDIKKIKNSSLLISIGYEFNILPKNIKILFINKHFQLSFLQEMQPFLTFQNKNIDNYIQNQLIYNYSIYGTDMLFSPKIVKKIAITIYTKLLILFPDKKNKLKENLKIFQKKLSEMDKKVFSDLKFIRNKKYYIICNSFFYFERYYNLNSIKMLLDIYHTNNLSIQYLYAVKSYIMKHSITRILSDIRYNNKIISFLFSNLNVHECIINPIKKDIKITKESYFEFFLNFSDQYINCIKSY